MLATGGILIIAAIIGIAWTFALTYLLDGIADALLRRIARRLQLDEDRALVGDLWDDWTDPITAPEDEDTVEVIFPDWNEPTVELPVLEPPVKRPTKTLDEMDAVSGWRQMLRWRASQVAAIKRRLRRRERHTATNETRGFFTREDQ